VKPILRPVLSFFASESMPFSMHPTTARVDYAWLMTKISKDDPLPPDSELPKVRLFFTRAIGSLENHSNQVGQDDWKLLAKYAGGLDG